MPISLLSEEHGTWQFYVKAKALSFPYIKLDVSWFMIHNVSKDQVYFLILIQISMKENSYKLVSANAYLINYTL